MNKKISVKNPFCSGDYVVYPAHGVGKVADITKQSVAGSELELIVVNFDKDKMTLRIPMAKAETTGLRKISEADTMADALSTLKGKAKVKKKLCGHAELRNMKTKSIPAVRWQLPRLFAICTAAKTWQNNPTANVRFMSRLWIGLPMNMPFLKTSPQKQLLKSCWTFLQNKRALWASNTEFERQPLVSFTSM